MEAESLTPVAHVETIDGGIVLTFEDGEGAFLSTNVMHHAVSEAKELPEFPTQNQKASVPDRRGSH